MRMFSSLIIVALLSAVTVKADTASFQPSAAPSNYVQQYAAPQPAVQYPNTYQYSEPAPGGGYSVQTGYEGYLVPVEEQDEGLFSSWGGFFPRSVLVHFLPQAGLIAGKVALFLLGASALLFIGTAFTVGVCTFTPICKLTIFGWPFSKESMRSYITPDRLTQATIFVRQAIDKYRDLQKEVNGGDKREAKKVKESKETKE